MGLLEDERTDVDELVDDEVEETVDAADLPSLEGDKPRCECDHGTEEEYIPCGRRARWRVSIDCQCGENHPRSVEILCNRCLRTLRRTQGRESITARRL